jgi:2-polyprenyl-3-methyl-5-hydroxy-6-metoxy-1,4-benzoquinol methylase
MKKSYQFELLDEVDTTILTEDLCRNLDELNFINTHLGGHAINVMAFKKLAVKQKDITVIEIGCGGGDNLRSLATFAINNNYNCKFVGIDAKKDCISYAINQSKNFSNITYVCSKYEDYNLVEQPHIIFNSLFCHHFSEKQIITMLHWMKQNCSIGFFINDLHRNRMAFLAIKVLTQLFSKSYLVKNDAPLSVQRGFKSVEWQAMLKQANCHANVSWKWAFRHLISFTHG